MSSTLPHLVPKQSSKNASEDACPMTDEQLLRWSFFTNSSEIGKCDWSPRMQAMVYASFSYGFIATHLPGTANNRHR